jgi:D-xylose transport system substrate-binding protein
MQLLKGTKPNVAEKSADGTLILAQTPDVITVQNMQKVFDDGNAKLADICTQDVKQACDRAGLRYKRTSEPGDGS